MATITYKEIQILFHWEKNRQFIGPYEIEIWRITSKNNRVPLWCHFKLCASCLRHLWIKTGVTVWKCRNRGKVCFNPCDLVLWLWPVTSTLSIDIICSMIITFGILMMRTLQGHWKRNVTDGRTEVLTQIQRGPFVVLHGRRYNTTTEQYPKHWIKTMLQKGLLPPSLKYVHRGQGSSFGGT